jgi:FtsZ-binding cell division protein ZapB
MGQPPETSKPAEEQPAAEPAVEQQPAATMTETPSGSELVTIALTSGEPMATLKFAMSRKDISEPRYADRLPESHPAHDMLGVLSFVALTKIKAITLTLTDTAQSKQQSWTSNVANDDSVIAVLSHQLKAYGIAQPTIRQDGSVADYDNRLNELVRTGRLQLTDTVTAYVEETKPLGARESFQMACRDFVQFIHQRVDGMYIEPIMMTPGPLIDPDRVSAAEYDAHMAKYEPAQPTYAGCMVAFEYEGQFYLGTYVYSRAERMAGNVDRNYAIWQAIRFAHAPKEVSDRPLIHFRRERFARQHRRQWLSTLKYQVDDIFSGTAAINDTIYSRVKFRSVEQEQDLDWIARYQESGGTLEEEPAPNSLGALLLQAKEQEAQLRGQMPTADGAEVPQELATKVQEAEKTLQELYLEIQQLVTTPSFDQVMTAEQREILFMVNQRLKDEHRQRVRTLLSEGTPRSQLPPMPPEKTERELLSEYGFISDYMAAAQALRMTFQNVERSRAFLPVAGKPRMQTLEELANSLPNWVPDEPAHRQPLMDFYVKSMQRHAKAQAAKKTPPAVTEQAAAPAGSVAETQMG